MRTRQSVGVRHTWVLTLPVVVWAPGRVAWLCSCCLWPWRACLNVAWTRRLESRCGPLSCHCCRTCDFALPFMGAMDTHDCAPLRRPLASHSSATVRQQLAITIARLPCICSVPPSVRRASDSIVAATAASTLEGAGAGEAEAKCDGPSDGNDRVECTQCTMLNDASRSRCEACEARLPSRRRTRRSPRQAARSTRAAGRESLTPAPGSPVPRADATMTHGGEDCGDPVVRRLPWNDCSCAVPCQPCHKGRGPGNESCLLLWHQFAALLDDGQPAAVRRVFAQGTRPRCAMLAAFLSCGTPLTPGCLRQGRFVPSGIATMRRRKTRAPCWATSLQDSAMLTSK